MIHTAKQKTIFIKIKIPQVFSGFIFVFLAVFTLYAQTSISTSSNGKTMIVDDAKDNVIISFGKTVIVKKEAEEVLSFGGDILIEGKISGDVAAIGGDIIQEENAFIGGDVFVLGGTYRTKSEAPLRNKGKETVMLAMFEDQFRDFSQNPAQILSPNLSWSFFAQRLLSILFWFIVSMALTTLAPGAVSRAVARFQLSTLKIIAIGAVSFLFTIICTIGSFNFLPTYLSAIVGLMAFVLLMLGYFFGRVALQVSVGKQLQKRFLAEKNQSETAAILFGVLFWTIFLSVPYIWIFALLALFSASLGLVLTARSPNGWRKSA